MGHPSHRRNGSLNLRSPRIRSWGALVLLALLTSAAGASSNFDRLIASIREQSKHIRRHLPGLDLASFDLESLLQRAESGEGSRAEITKELSKTALNLNLAAKAEVLTRIRQAHQASRSLGTDEDSYSKRRQLVLSFDFLERAAGRRPIYPRKLGRPFVALVENPAKKDLQLCDNFLAFLAKIPLPKSRTAGGGSGSAGGLGGGEEEGDEDSPGSPGGGGYLPASRGSHPRGEADPGGPPEDDTPTTNRGWELVRWYIFGTLFALFSLYALYLVYTALKGGSNLITYLRQAFRSQAQVPGDGQDPFRKGLSLFGQAKFQDAIRVLEPLTERALQSTQPARYYLLLSALKIRKSGLVETHFPLLDREKFSPDELYRLGNALEEAGAHDARALEIFRYLAERDPSLRDVAKRAEKLDAKVSIS